MNLRFNQPYEAFSHNPATHGILDASGEYVAVIYGSWEFANLVAGLLTEHAEETRELQEIG